VLAALMLGLFGTPMAQAAPLGETETKEILSRITDGTWTQQDLELLKQRAPQVAAQIANPDEVLETHLAVSVTSRTLVPLATPTKCRSVEKTYLKKTLLGFTAYKWYHFSEYCWSAGKITSWQQNRDRTSDVNAAFSVEGIVERYTSSVNRRSSFAYIQRKITNCVAKYGCIATFHPWSRTTADGITGKDSEQGSAG